MANKPNTFVRPTKEQLEESYARLKSIRKVGVEFGYTGEGIRVMMHELGLVTTKPNKDMYSCDYDFFSRDNEESFYVAGFFAADGCVKCRRQKKEPSVVYMALGVKDADHLLRMKNLMKIEHPLHKKIVKNHLRNPEWADSEQRELHVSSSKMCQDLNRFNIVPRKTHIYTFPEWLVDHPLVHHFMRGYNDGDGSFFIPNCYNGTTHPQVYFSLRGTLKFLTVYRSILERECGLSPREKDIRVNCGIGVLEYGGNGVLAKITDYLYRNATIYLQRKYEISKKSKEQNGLQINDSC